jgi:alkaline phosphatase D
MKTRLCFLILVLLLLAACKREEQSKVFTEIVAPLYDSTLAPFYHGVASGDPLDDRVIIWTRVTPVDSVSKISVTWQMAEDEAFSTVYKTDTVSTSPLRDYTVKVDVLGLKPGRHYYYRFSALGATSMVGRTKTLPLQTDSVSLAVVSCSNWEFGYFNAYEKISERAVDAVVHLGDYIYEYGVGGYGDSTVDRKHLPAHEIITLQDYRTRYSQYHTDQGLRKARQQHAFISIWDDHEVANNVFTQGAQNHQPDKEGDFEKRKAAARQAYYEWLPIREGQKHYRAFSFGNLVDLIMLDERLEGRTKSVDSISDPKYTSDAQTMLGSEQVRWLENNLLKSKAAWKVIGNQVIFSEVDQSGPYPSQPRNLDSWDGFPYEQKKIASLIRDNNISNTVFITGDTHASWAFEVADVKKYNSKTAAGAYGIEFGTPSVSSSNWNEYETDDNVLKGEQLLFKANPHLKYGNARDHGYLLLTLTTEKARAEWWYVSTLRQPIATEKMGKRMEVAKGTFKLK